MDIRNKFKLGNETILIIVGSLLLIISFLLFHYSKILEVNDQIINSIQSEIYKETTSENISVNIDVSYVEVDNSVEKHDPEIVINYIGFLEIEKIGLKQGFLPKTSYYNNVDFHIEILDISDFPDKVNGNFILAGHSGTSNVAYFKNLYKLKLGDIANIYYQGKVYRYTIVNIYNQVKDGSVNIYRNSDKTTLTLITCTKDDKNSQTIYILELASVEMY